MHNPWRIILTWHPLCVDPKPEFAAHLLRSSALLPLSHSLALRASFHVTSPFVCPVRKVLQTKNEHEIVDTTLWPANRRRHVWATRTIAQMAGSSIADLDRSKVVPLPLADERVVAPLVLPPFELIQRACPKVPCLPKENDALVLYTRASGSPVAKEEGRLHRRSTDVVTACGWPYAKSPHAVATQTVERGVLCLECFGLRHNSLRERSGKGCESSDSSASA